MTASERHADLLALRKMFEDALVAAAKERSMRQIVVDGEMEWIRFERDLMHRLVNNARVVRGKDQVTLAAIRRCEQLAVGHVDYGTKFPLYLAELVQLELCSVCGKADCEHQRIQP
jgi:hypothetical protein